MIRTSSAFRSDQTTANTLLSSDAGLGLPSLTTLQHNHIVVFMLPPADPATGYLPSGVHSADWSELAARFATNGHRSRLIDGLLAALQNLAGAGCRSVLLDGSFVTLKDLPNDYDGAWDITGVNPDLLDPVLLDFSNSRAAMKSKYQGELFPASAVAAPGVLYRDFFMKDRNGVPKGVVTIDLGRLP